jgi:hypothetical protein
LDIGSNTAYVPQVSLFTEQLSNLKTEQSPNQIYTPSNVIGTSHLRHNSTNMSDTESFKLPITANITFPSESFNFENKEINLEGVTKTQLIYLTVSKLPPLDFCDYISIAWAQWDVALNGFIGRI